MKIHVDRKLENVFIEIMITQKELGCLLSSEDLKGEISLLLEGEISLKDKIYNIAITTEEWNGVYEND